MPSCGRGRASGFSLVELMVAVMFIGILMAGMANVFKASVSTLTTSSEGISSARRNRMSIDLLYDDLNSAGMYLTNLSLPPTLNTANPAFYVLPNMPVTGPTGPVPLAADDPQTADQLMFYLDEALPFEGTLTYAGVGTTPANNANQLVNQGGPPMASDFTLTIDCKDASYANMVKSGYSLIVKDASETYSIQGAPALVGTSSVTVTLGPSASAGVTGQGPSGLPSKTSHIVPSGVVFFNPAQMVRYRVVMENYDPQKVNATPCLIREQTTYNPAGWAGIPAANITTSILAENIAGFKVYLSANTGQGWVGLNKTAYTGFSGWSTGMRPDLDAQLAAVGRPGFTTTQGDENWIRDIPVLVRLDITTRTAMKRSEYSATPLTTTAYRNFTQSLVIVPRHFGLTMN